MTDRPTIGTCICRRREAQCLTQRKLAAASNVSSNFVYTVENDRHHNTQRLERVANALGLSLLATFAAPDSEPFQPTAYDYAAQNIADERFCLVYRSLPPRQRRQLQRMLQNMLAPK